MGGDPKWATCLSGKTPFDFLFCFIRTNLLGLDPILVKFKNPWSMIKPWNKNQNAKWGSGTEMNPFLEPAMVTGRPLWVGLRHRWAHKMVQSALWQPYWIQEKDNTRMCSIPSDAHWNKMLLTYDSRITSNPHLCLITKPWVCLLL